MSEPDHAAASVLLPPSGKQRTLRSGEQEAVVVGTGGGLRSWTAGGSAVLDGYDEHEMASAGRGQVLLPWPNRLRAGRWTWRGRDLSLPLSEPGRGEHGNAIHGLARWLTWDLEQPAADHVVARHELAPQPGYPFRLGCEVDYRLAAAGSDEDGLSVRVTVHNRSQEPAPVGVGIHPYVAAEAVGGPGATADDLTITVPGRTRLLVGDDGIPTGREPVAGASDWRAGHRVGGEQVDVAWTDLERGPDGWARVLVEGERGRLELALDPGWRWVQVFTGDTVPQTERRRRGVALEPMSCPPDALASGDDLWVVEPGESTSAEWRMRLDR